MTDQRNDETPDPLILIAGWLAETFCDADFTSDIDGLDLEEALQETGFVRAETYDPEKHGSEPQGLGLEPGEDQILTLTAKAVQARKRYRQWSANLTRCSRCNARGAQIATDCPIASSECPVHPRTG